MKKWLVITSKTAKSEGIRFKPVGNIHDEGQFEVHEDDVKRFCEICEESMVLAGEALGFRCKIEGEAMVGDNWASTH